MKEKIAEHLIRHINIKENFENKQNEEKEEKISLIIEKSIEKLEKSKKVFVKDQQREKIKRHISKFLEEVSDEILTFNKKDLIDVFHQELYKKQSKWSKLVNYLGIKSYSISSENIERIKGVMNSKIKNFHYPIINQEIQKQLKQISKELNNFNNSKLPSEIKKAKPEIQKNEKPPIPPKPQNLKKGKRVLDHK